jgi:dihydroorotase
VIVIENALVLRAGGVESTNVVIDGGKVAVVGPVDRVNGARVIDARGWWLGPGLVDLHVHLRDPGQTWKEDLTTGARAAAAGGFTAVVAMPNTDPPIDTGSRAMAAISRASAIDDVEISIAGTLTRGRGGDEMAELIDMYEAGVRLFSDDGDSVPGSGLLRRVMSCLADLPGAVAAEHSEDPALSAGGQINEGEMSALLGLPGLPGVAEDVIVARDIALARDTGARLHVQHVSTKFSADLIRAAKASGMSVTAEVAPHHLRLDEGALSELDPNLKMYPPLRTAADRLALMAGLVDGSIDAVATDHAPHTDGEKSVPFEEAPRGVIGLETAAAIAFDALRGDQASFFDRMSSAPARIAGLSSHGSPVEPGAPANLVLFDPNRRWTPQAFFSKSQNTPFLGMELVGKVMATIHEGRVSYEGDL